MVSTPPPERVKLQRSALFYKYLTNKVHLIKENPVKDLDSPKLKKTLPKYLTLEESVQLLSSVDGQNRERDYCILTLFLNCGLRISELCALNTTDIQDDALRVLGKGNKVRIVYLNDACKEALNGYLAVRPIVGARSERPLPLLPQRARQPLDGPRAGEKALERGRARLDAVFRAQAAPHSGDTDAAKRRGRQGRAGGSGP